MRLVREQGYAATTVEQIAVAADVSPSTFFRYFPTKDDAVLYDPYDPLMIESFRPQPADLSPIQALRRATRAVFAALPADELVKTRDLLALVFGVAELRVRMLDELARSGQLVAERTGRRTDELAVQTFACALVGATMAVMSTAATDPEADVLELVDSALELLERGLPL